MHVTRYYKSFVPTAFYSCCTMFLVKKHINNTEEEISWENLSLVKQAEFVHSHKQIESVNIWRYQLISSFNGNIYELYYLHVLIPFYQIK